MLTYTFLMLSVLLNILLVWYNVKILRKFMFISEHMSDLFLTVRAFQVFVKSIYSMQSYHGEPILEELIQKLKEVKEEMDDFRNIFEHTLDEELEEELDAAEEETQEIN